MGEARRRGTYAERRAAAIAREYERLKMVRMSRHRKAAPLSRELVAILAMVEIARQE